MPIYKEGHQNFGKSSGESNEAEERLKKLGLTTLKVRRERGDLIEYFKISKGYSKVDWHNPSKLTSSFFWEGPDGNIRGQKHILVKQYTRISHREHFILNRVVDN